MAIGDAVVVNATYTITQADIDSGAQLVNIARVVDSDSTTEPDPAPIPTEEPQTSGITISKGTVNALNGEQVILPDAQFNVGLFYDAELTQPAGDFAVLDFSGSSAASASFGGLLAGTYYVTEVDANDTLV